ncbi:MAG: VOC family protein [Pseudomonadales bacterium]|nr:VOC family protein [Candidatus Woesebacteria bacterium]MCB9800623.1 VOC family protein [Pseudomonadales bacterium]
MKNITTELMVDNMAKSINFYRDILGFTIIISEPKETPFFVILQNGSVELMLYHRNQFSQEIPKFKDMSVGGSIALYIGVEEVEELYKSLSGKVKIIQELHTTDYGSVEFSCEDNSGYVLMFNERN